MGASPKRLRNGMLAWGDSSPLPSLSPLSIRPGDPGGRPGTRAAVGMWSGQTRHGGQQQQQPLRGRSGLATRGSSALSSLATTAAPATPATLALAPFPPAASSTSSRTTVVPLVALAGPLAQAAVPAPAPESSAPASPPASAPPGSSPPYRVSPSALPPTLAAAYELYTKLSFLLASTLRGDSDDPNRRSSSHHPRPEDDDQAGDEEDEFARAEREAALLDDRVAAGELGPFRRAATETESTGLPLGLARPAATARALTPQQRRFLETQHRTRVAEDKRPQRHSPTGPRLPSGPPARRPPLTPSPCSPAVL